MTCAVTVLGLGAIGLPVAEALAQGRIEGMHLHSVAASSPESVAAKRDRIGGVPALTLSQIGQMGDLVVECLPPGAFGAVAAGVLGSGRRLFAVSVGGLLRHPDILALAEASGAGRLLLPSGAFGGLDAVRAIAWHPEAEIRLVSAKPVAAFEQSDYLTTKGITLAAITERTCLFDGAAAEGVRHFPKNVNVVAALALAGVGPAATHLSIWADPGLTANTHLIEAVSPISRFSAEIANLPDAANPRTSAITAFSVMAGLRNLGRGWTFA